MRHGTAVEVEIDDWLEGTLLLSMEVTLRAEVESDLKGLPENHRGAITMLRFIIKRLVVCNQDESMSITLISIASQARMFLPHASSSRPSSMFLARRFLLMLSVPSLKGLLMHLLQTSLTSAGVKLLCAVTVSMHLCWLRFLFVLKLALCWTILNKCIINLLPQRSEKE